MSLQRYEIRYTDKHDPICPVFVWTCRAYDLAHAEEKFIDSCYADGDDGWKIVSIKRAKKRD